MEQNANQVKKKSKAGGPGSIGDNRLSALEHEARQGLERVTQGEELSIAGWLAYGMALNEGRSLFPGDREFGEWLRTAKLAERNGEPVHDHDRAAAMWAAANADQFEEARQRGNPRTIRGIHAKWKEIEAEREAEAQREERPIEPDPAQDPGEGSAQVIEPASEPDPEPAGAEDQPVEDGFPDPYAEERKRLAKFTREGLEDELIETRIALAEEKDRRKKVAAEVRELKNQVRDYFADDKDEVIRRLQATIANKRRSAEQDNDKLKKEKAKTYALGKRIEELEAEIRRMEIPLN